jgi:hypothetical protein
MCFRAHCFLFQEQNEMKKRKRPVKKSSAKATGSRLQFAKEAAETLKSRQEQLKSQLASLEGSVYVPPATSAAPPVEEAAVRAQKIEESSSESSSDSSSSSGMYMIITFEFSSNTEHIFFCR